MPKIIGQYSPITKSEKVAYVKRQGQTRDHHCHWPGCDKQVPPAMWGCYPHWMKLPKRLRDAIWASFRPGQETNWTPSREYVKVAREVQQWIKENCGVSSETSSGSTSQEAGAGSTSLPSSLKNCKACGGEGINSKGGPCHPCLSKGRLQWVNGKIVLVPKEHGIVGSLSQHDLVHGRRKPSLFDEELS